MNARAARPALAVLLAVLAIALGPAARGVAQAPAQRQGTHEGADFVIGMPATWNGGLVMYAHGYEGEGPGKGSVRTPSLGNYLTEHGYAWAASGYRSKGYRPAATPSGGGGSTAW